MKWKEELSAMPKLTEEQIEAVKRIVDRHTSDLVFDYPRADDALFMVNRDLESLRALGVG